MQPIRASLWVLLQYDVSEEIDLDQLRKLLRVPHADRGPSFRHPTPEYVRFERPPVTQPIRTELLEPGQQLSGQIKFFDYGVISMLLELQVEATWDDLLHLLSRWINTAEMEVRARELVRKQAGPVRSALIKPHSEWLSEEYYVLHVREMLDADRQAVSAEALLAKCGERIAQIVRGELNRLSPGERQEVLQSSMSYCANDLLVIGWTAAFIYDNPEGAAPTIQLLEYANTQLLEFRYYDALLTNLFADVYKHIERHQNLLRRWGLARQANHLNGIRLDVTELTERIDNSIKFISDMFYARAYKLAAQKIGVTDYRNLVDEKLRTAAELYHSMVEEFHQARAFVLELLVVAILVIELIFLFRGKS